MRNDISPFERFSKLCFQVAKLVMEGKRDAEQVADVLQVILDKKDFGAISRQGCTPADILSRKTCWHDEWLAFYAEVFGMGDIGTKLDSVIISDERSYLSWVVMIPQGLTLNLVWAKCRDRFPSYSSVGEDLDAAVPTSDRTSETAYAMFLRDHVEADEENKGLSANHLARLKMRSITLLERLVLELWYNWRTGRHLDTENVTLCAGSRRSDGRVPTVAFHIGMLVIFSQNPDPPYQHAYPGSVGDDIRSRSVSDSPFFPECPSVELVCSAPDVFLPGPVNRK
jgi:hypothetical protein